MKFQITLLSILVLEISSSSGYLEFMSNEFPTSTNKSMVIHRFENRKNVLLFKSEIIRPLNHVFVSVNLYKEENFKFRQLFKSKDYDWCKIVSKKSKSNPLFRTFFEPLSKKVPAISKCPLYGNIELNATFERKLVMVFPNGVYKLDVHAYRNDDENIITTTLVLKIDN